MPFSYELAYIIEEQQLLISCFWRREAAASTKKPAAMLSISLPPNVAPATRIECGMCLVGLAVLVDQLPCSWV